MKTAVPVLVLFGFILSAACAVGSVSVPLNKGYNLISAPFPSVSFSGHEACGIDQIWTYYDGRYISAAAGSSPLGINYASFFVYARNQCTLTLNDENPGAPILKNENLWDLWARGGGGLNFKRGWNFVAGFEDSARFEDVKGDCNVVNGPYYYDSAGRKWVPATRLEQEKGYIVKVSGNCQFGYEEAGLPPFPE